MTKHPGSSSTVYFEHRKKTNDALTDAAIVSIVVKDPTKVVRITYNAANLVRVSTGSYYYTFIIPDVVLPGAWYAEVTAGISPDIDVKRAYFQVEE